MKLRLKSVGHHIHTYTSKECLKGCRLIRLPVNMEAHAHHCDQDPRVCHRLNFPFLSGSVLFAVRHATMNSEGM